MIPPHTTFMLAAQSTTHWFDRSSPLPISLYHYLLYGNFLMVPLAPHPPPISPNDAIVANIVASTTCSRLIVRSRTKYTPPFYSICCHKTRVCKQYTCQCRPLCISLYPTPISSDSFHIPPPFHCVTLNYLRSIHHPTLTHLPFTPANPSYHIPIPYPHPFNFFLSPLPPITGPSNLYSSLNSLTTYHRSS